MNGHTSSLPPDDDVLLDTLRAAWEANDPVPPHLVERVSFAVALEGLEAELAVLADEMLEPAGARAAEPARTLTFTTEHASVMVTLTPRAGGRFRGDGWVAPAGSGLVELRRTGTNADGDATAGGGRVHARRLGDVAGGSPSEPDRATVDAQGRFALPDVGSGMVQLVYLPDPGGALTRPVAAPPVVL